CTTEGDDW
nr:immunoglobulin heavy chain junction region [Macaca mulatta]MPN70824.1 immunoglobulin heavy chain junction region [Macaca mulatta]MPN75942.1 immunoglobulin heavy chain junction region [Macaca mulatta]